MQTFPEQNKRSTQVLFIDTLSSSYPESGQRLYGIKLLRSYLESAGIKTEVLRCVLPDALSETHVEFAAKVMSYAPTIVAFSTFACNYLDSLLIARSVKALSPGTLVLMGGPQASATAEESLKAFPFVDVICCGESDVSAPELVDRLLKSGTDALESVPGVVYRDRRGNVVSNPPAAEPFPLEKLPFIPVEDRGPSPGPLLVMMEAGRGCAAKCPYCPTSLFWGNGAPRLLPAAGVIERMRSYLISAREKPVKFCFTSDNLTQDEAWLSDFLKRMTVLLKDYPGTLWELRSRPGPVSAELAGRLVAAGCSSIFLGLETGSISISRRIKKVFDLQKILSALAVFNKGGTGVEVSFILGFPEESAADLNATLSLALRLRLAGAHPALHLLAVMPKTPIAASAELEFLRIYSNFSTYEGNRLSVFKADKAVLEALIEAHPRIFPFHYSVKNLNGVSPSACRFLENYGNIFLWFVPASLLLLSRASGLTLFETMEEFRKAGAVTEASRPGGVESSLLFFSDLGEKLLAERGAGGGWFSAFVRYETLARGFGIKAGGSRVLSKFLTALDLRAFEAALEKTAVSDASAPEPLIAERGEPAKRGFLLWLWGKPVFYVKSSCGEKLGPADFFRIAALRFGKRTCRNWAREYPSKWLRSA